MHRAVSRIFKKPYPKANTKMYYSKLLSKSFNGSFDCSAKLKFSPKSLKDRSADGFLAAAKFILT